MNQSVALTYDQLRLFVVTAMPYAFDLGALSHADHPLTAIEALERKSQAQAMSGIKMAASDLVSMFANESASKLKQIEADLADAGSPSLALVTAYIRRNTTKIVQRGAIKSDEEFEQMKAVLDTPNLDDELRTKLQSLVDGYEFGKS